MPCATFIWFVHLEALVSSCKYNGDAAGAIYYYYNTERTIEVDASSDVSLVSSLEWTTARVGIFSLNDSSPNGKYKRKEETGRSI